MLFRLRLLILCLLPMHAQASDPLSWTELERLYHADLAIDAQLVRQDGSHFWVRVNTVLRDQHYGIKAGDAIRVDKAASYSCGFPLSLGDRRRWRLYLQKEEGKGHWALTAHSADNAIEVNGERAIIYMPAELVLPIDVLDRCLIEFQTCYALADSGDSFTAVCDQARIDSLAANNAILAQFERQGHMVREAQLNGGPEVPLEQPPPAPLRECAWMDQRPRKRGDPGDADGPVLSMTLPDPTPGAPGSRTVVLQVLVDVDGRVHDATILRGSNPQRETEALRTISHLPLLEPARSQGVTTSCYERFPIRFVAPEE